MTALGHSPDYYAQVLALLARRLTDDGLVGAAQTVIEATYTLPEPSRHRTVA